MPNLLRAALALAAILMCLGPAFAGDKLRVRLQLKWYHQFQFAGFYAAQKLGYFDQAHFQVDILERDPTRSVRKAVATGRAEFGVDDGTSLLHDRMLGQPFVALGVVFQTSPLILLSIAGHGIRTVDDLRGGTIMLNRDAAEEVALLAMLKRGASTALDPLREVRIVQHSFDLSDLVERRVDAVSAYATHEPFALRERGFEPVLIHPVDYGVDFYGDTLFTSEEFASANTEAIERFREACFHGWEYALSHADELADHILSLPSARPWPVSREMLLAEATAMQKYMAPRLVQTGQMNPARWRAMAETLKEFRLVPKESHWVGFEYGELLERQRREKALAMFAWGTAGSILVVSLALFWIQQLRILVRKRTAELAFSEQRHRALLDAVPDAMFVNRQDGTFLEFRGSADTLVPPEQFLGKTIAEVLPPAQAPSMTALVQRAISTGVMQNLEYPLEQADTQRHFEARSVRCGPNEALTLIRDVTERKETESRLVSLAAALEQAAGGVVITNSHRIISYANRAFETIRRVSRHELIGKPLQIHSANSGEDELWQRAAQEAWRGRLTQPLPDGSPLVLDCSLAAIRADSDSLTGFVATFRDVTRQVRLETHLANKERLEALGTLAGGIAHDFNNILCALSGYAETALLDSAEGSSVQWALRNILLGTERAAELVRQILAFSRQSDLERSTLAIQPLAEDAVRFLRATIPASIEIELQVSTDACVVANPMEIQRILVNLGTNAAQAMPRQVGRIEISATETETGPAARNEGAACWILLVVRDNGTGMPPEILNRIFEPFFSTHKKSGGTGMGLAVVHGIVTDLGGTITVTSQEGVGSTFEILLPASAHAPRREPVSSPEQGLGKERILLVDDEAMVIDSHTAYLQGRAGFRVTPFLDPLEALEAFRASPRDFDMVVTDMSMPGINGLDLAEAIRALDAEIPILLCTGYSELVTEERLNAIGRMSFAQKPLAGKRLVEAIRRCLDARQPCKPD